MIFRNRVAKTKLVEQLTLVTLQTAHHGSTSPRFASTQRNHGSWPVSTDFCTWGNSGSSQTKARESALQERMRPASCGLATMESSNGILCRTGRVIEADIDLPAGPDGVGGARGRGRFRS